MSKQPDPQLLRAAVHDREAHPWRYYNLKHDVMKRLLDDQAQQIATLTEERLATQTHVANVLLHDRELEAQVATLTQEVQTLGHDLDSAYGVVRTLTAAMAEDQAVERAALETAEALVLTLTRELAIERRKR